MDELDVSDFKYGGVNLTGTADSAPAPSARRTRRRVNLTGFSIINTSSARYRAAQRDWTRRNPNYWLGARRRLTVGLPARTCFLCTARLTTIWAADAAAVASRRLS